MSEHVTGAPRATSRVTFAFALTTLASAGLVFLVEPMIAKLVLPMLGGGPSVWNTSMAFFQACLLAGYAYAHLLQKIPTLRRQAIVHIAVLAAAALTLPLKITTLLGPPDSERPILWLLGVLTLSLGAPFAALSATAPLVQAWYARTEQPRTGAEPYALYAASNLGSLVGLLSYPVLVEPFTRLGAQALAWSLGYVAFILIVGGLVLIILRLDVGAPTAVDKGAQPVTWRQRLTWVALAALPSSLMLGVTTYLTTDVASAPFLWAAPLTLYLLSFIVAFAVRPALSVPRALWLQGFAVAACVGLTPFTASNIILQLAAHLVAFFLTALVCHQALVARRPATGRLTEFYLWLSVGGVVGGGFNAFIAPVIFNNAYEYPIVLALACLARPAGLRPPRWLWATAAAGIGLALAAPAIAQVWGYESPDSVLAQKLVLAAAVLAACVVQFRRWLLFAVICAVTVGGQLVGDQMSDGQTWRSFFGIVTETAVDSAPLGGTVWTLAHGTTLHGAQAENPKYRCQPLIYYSPPTPIGQTYLTLTKGAEPLVMGTVGLGTGSVAAFTRPGDRMRFYEIDPLVVAIASDPEHFSYTTECAKGEIDYVIGDARLTLADEPDGLFDILLIDAFSSDAIPAHLLTVESMRLYLAKLKPNGVLILHLSNRNLELRSPAMAVAAAAGGVGLIQRHDAAPDSTPLTDTAEDAMIVAKTPQALGRFATDPRWTAITPDAAKPWTDDYMNLVGALYRRLLEAVAE